MINQELDRASAKAIIKKILSGQISQDSILKVAKSDDLCLYRNNLVALHKTYNKSVMCKQLLEMRFSSDFLLLIVFSINFLNNISNITQITKSQPALATTVSIIDKSIVMLLMNYISFIKNRRLSELGTMRYIILGYKNLLTAIDDKNHNILANKKDKMTEFYKFLNAFEDEAFKTFPVHYAGLILTMCLSGLSSIFNLKELNNTNSVTTYLGAIFGSMFLVYSFFLTANDLCKKMHKSKKIQSMLRDVREVIENALIEKPIPRVEEVKESELYDEENETHKLRHLNKQTPIKVQDPDIEEKKPRCSFFKNWRLFKSASVNTRVVVAQHIGN